MIKGVFIFLATCACAAMAFAQPAFAAGVPYKSYSYDELYWEEQPAPPLYLPETAAGMGLSAPSDMCVYGGEVYILDGGRVVVADWSLEKRREIQLTLTNGEPFAPGEAGGLFVCGGGIYVTDLEAETVCVFSHGGRLELTIGKPSSPLYDESLPVRARRVLADSAGNVYALVDGLYSGAALFSARGEFLGFYGANKVEMTVTMWADQMWKRMLSREQRDAMSRFVPVAYSGFDIDGENFIYTCSQDAQDVSARVRKLNPSGDSLWNRRALYGDNIPAGREVDGLVNKSLLVDVDISPDGVLSALDAAKGRVFQYDANGVMIGAFGGKGNQDGLFTDPVAVAGLEDYVYVLDAAGASVTAFAPTEYGRAVRRALELHNDGEYQKAAPYWREALMYNGYSQAAYIGLGKALYASGDTAGALGYLKQSGDREQYSQVFARARTDFARRHFTVFALGVLAAAALWGLRRRLPAPGFLRPLGRHLRVAAHPLAGIEDLLETGRLSVVFSTAAVLLWFAADVLVFFGEGFIFNMRRPQDFNLIFSAGGTVGAYALWVTVNWAVSVLTDGKGTFKMIYCAGAYALLPYLGAKLAALLMSRVMTADEAAFIAWVSAAGLAWAGLILFCSVMAVHQFHFEKAAANIFLTALGILVVLFLLFVAAVLFGHVANLFGIVYRELTLRR